MRGEAHMSGKGLLLLVVVVSKVGAGRASAAQDEAPVQHQRIGSDIGFGSALGFIGVDYQFAPVNWLRLEVGAGWGYTGAQFSFMPKLALGWSWRCAFTIGFGPSLALGSSQAAMEGHGPNPKYLPWLNLDVPGMECRLRSGLSFQATVGATMPLAKFHYDFSEVGNNIEAYRIFPQARVGIGWWF
jgi:hypothetical protein